MAKLAQDTRQFVDEVGGAEGGLEAMLMIVHGGVIGRSYSLARSQTTIGSAPDNDVYLDDSAAPYHAVVERKTDGWELCDLGTNGGTLRLAGEMLVRGTRAYLADGDLFWVGRTVLKVICSDNLERAHFEEIHRLAMMDGLTQVYNQRYLAETLVKEVARAQRYERPLSFAILELDGLPRIVQDYGPRWGELLQRQFAAFLRHRMRAVDVVAHVTGDGFAVVMPETQLGSAALVLAALRDDVSAAPFHLAGKAEPITFSAGVAALNEEIDSGGRLVAVATERMHAARAAGGDRVVATAGRR